MFNRIVLVLITLLSLSWIAYVSYDLIFQNDSLSPERVFEKSDKEILIINNLTEFSFEQVDFSDQVESNEILKDILSSPKQITHIFITKNASKIVLESSSLWSEKEIVSIFGKKISSSNDGEFLLSNGMKVQFKRNYCLISSSTFEQNENELTLPTWDKKSSASIINFSNPIRVTDIYVKEDGIIAYKTKSSKNCDSKKVNDKYTFGEVLPEKLKKYHFLEREFAICSGQLDPSSLLYQWTETGFVTFEYKGTPCIVSDFISNQDPLAVLKEQNSSSDELGNHFTGIQLTNHFPNNLNKGFYVAYLGDKVVLSEKKEVAENIVADFQLGKTVILSPEKSSYLFDKLPQFVSERGVSENQSFTKTSYKNILIHTINKKNSGDVTSDDKDEVQEDKTISQQLEGELLYLLGINNFQCALTSEQKMVGFVNHKKTWSYTFEGRLIGNPKIVQLDDNGKVGILFTTNSAIYLLDKKGKVLTGNPISIEASNPATLYRWKNTAQLVVVDEKGELVQFDLKGKEQFSLKTGLSSCKEAADVFVQNGNVIVVLNDPNKSITVNLNTRKILKTRSSLPENYLVVKSKDGLNYYSFEEGSLLKIDYTGKQVVLGNYPTPDYFRVCEGKNNTFIGFSSYNKLHILNEDGIKLAQIDIPFRKLASFDILTLGNGKTYIALVDALENNVYVFDKAGKSLLAKPLEGKGNVLLTEEQGKLNLSIAVNEFLVQYLDVLSN